MLKEDCPLTAFKYVRNTELTEHLWAHRLCRLPGSSLKHCETLVIGIQYTLEMTEGGGVLAPRVAAVGLSHPFLAVTAMTHLFGSKAE